MRLYEVVEYKRHLDLLMSQLRAEGVFSEAVTLDIWCSGSDKREEWFVDNQICRIKYIHFKVRFQQHQEEWSRLLVGWHKLEVLGLTLERGAEVFVPTLGSLSRYDLTRLLYMPTPTVFPYCTGVYRNCRDEL